MKTEKQQLKETKSDEKLNNKPIKKTVQIDNLQNMVIISSTRFCFTVIIVFLFGMITGMILNAPTDLNQIGLD